MSHRQDLWLGCMAIMCVCDLPLSSHCPLMSCCAAQHQTVVCSLLHPSGMGEKIRKKKKKIELGGWDKNLTKLKKSHFLSFFFFLILIKEITEEVLEIPPSGTEDVPKQIMPVMI